MKLALALAALAVGGCVSLELARPTPAQYARATTRGADAAFLDHGRELVSTRCAACHAPPQPASRAPEAWPADVARMAARSHLSDDDRRAVTAYLQVCSQP